MRARVFFYSFFFSVHLIGQPPADRYQSNIFSSVTETMEVLFSSGVPVPVKGGGLYEFLTGLPLNVKEYSTSPKDLKMDIFQPSGDTLEKRPLIIICFGGGFLTGSKDHWSIRLLCQELAKRGFVTAAIDYRLGMNIFDEDLSIRAVYRGIQDARSAIRFFRADATNENVYKIDPNQIFLGGHSAGAFISLHEAYLEKETERPLSTYDWLQGGNDVPDQLCLDCVGDNQAFDGHANAIFSLAGGIGFTSLIETNNDPKCVMFHSMDDGTVEYDSGEPFGDILWLVVGSDLPIAYGSLPISLKMDTVDLPYEFHSYTSRGHGVHENGSVLYDDIVPGISDFFYQEELKPIYDTIHGPPVVCMDLLEQNYSLLNGSGVYYKWSVEGGSFTYNSTSSNTVSVLWNPLASIKSISVLAFNENDAASDSLSLVVTSFDNADNSVLKSSNLWSDPANWNLGHVPTPCENVVIDVSSEPYSLNISLPYEINSLVINSGNILNIFSSGKLFVNRKSSVGNTAPLLNSGIIENGGYLRIRD